MGLLEAEVRTLRRGRSGRALRLRQLVAERDRASVSVRSRSVRLWGSQSSRATAGTGGEEGWGMFRIDGTSSESFQEEVLLPVRSSRNLPPIHGIFAYNWDKNVLKIYDQ